MKILHCNLHTASNYPPPPNSLLISIVSPTAPSPQFLPGWDRIVSLAFSDVDTLKNLKPKLIERYKIKLFTIGCAITIINAVRSNEWDLVLVHCEAGISRSAAVAKALEEIVNNRRINSPRFFLANTHVYRTMIEANHAITTMDYERSLIQEEE